MKPIYGLKVLIDPDTREVFSPRSKQLLGTMSVNFNLTDCYFRAGRILGEITDTNPSRDKIPLKVDASGFRLGTGELLTVTYLDNITFDEFGMRY